MEEKRKLNGDKRKYFISKKKRNENTRTQILKSISKRISSLAPLSKHHIRMVQSPINKSHVFNLVTEEEHENKSARMEEKRKAKRRSGNINRRSNNLSCLKNALVDSSHCMSRVYESMLYSICNIEYKINAFLIRTSCGCLLLHIFIVRKLVLLPDAGAFWQKHTQYKTFSIQFSPWINQGYACSFPPCFFFSFGKHNLTRVFMCAGVCLCVALWTSFILLKHKEREKEKKCLCCCGTPIARYLCAFIYKDFIFGRLHCRRRPCYCCEALAKKTKWCVFVINQNLSE